MTTQHTGGNWYAERVLNTIDKQPNDLNTWHVKSTLKSPYVDAPRSICCFDCSPAGKANAHLIAAAPELLDVVKRIYAIWDDPDRSPSELADSVDRDWIRAAIAKATGGEE